MFTKKQTIALVGLLNRRRKRNLAKRRVWEIDFFRHRKSYGEYRRIFCQIKKNIDDDQYREKFFSYTRMSPECWNKLLKLLEKR